MGDRSEMAGFYVAAAIVGTCHDSDGGVSGHGMIGSELRHDFGGGGSSREMIGFELQMS